MDNQDGAWASEELNGVPRPGELISAKYEVDGLIGLGGMGAVLAGTHLLLEQPVAIKFLLPAFAKNGDMRSRFVREAKSAARLRSDHVTRILDVGAIESGLPYIVMERLQGTSLDSWLEAHGPVPVHVAVEWVVQACEAVAEAHAAGVVHRDLKPANLFLAEKPNGSVAVKVLDFGISKHLASSTSRPRTADLTGPDTLLGSPHYMSPEQVRDAREVDTATDIWALGVILYELVTGRMPFEAASIPHLYAVILSNDPVPASRHAPDLPSGFENVIASCLVKDANRRLHDVAQLARMLAPFGDERTAAVAEQVARVLEQGPTSSLRPSPIPSVLSLAPTRIDPSTPPMATSRFDRASTLPGKRRPYVTAAVAGVLAMLIVGLAAIFTLPKSTASEGIAKAPGSKPSRSLSTAATAVRSAPHVLASAATESSPGDTAVHANAASHPQREPGSTRPTTPIRDLTGITLLE